VILEKYSKGSIAGRNIDCTIMYIRLDGWMSKEALDKGVAPVAESVKSSGYSDPVGAP
jgi:hypothetical protein